MEFQSKGVLFSTLVFILKSKGRRMIHQSVEKRVSVDFVDRRETQRVLLFSLFLRL